MKSSERSKPIDAPGNSVTFACETFALLAAAPVILVVHPSVPARTAKEFVALAKARPGELNLASGAIGSSTYLGGELLKLVAKINVVNIPYKGTGQAISDVLGG